MHAINVKDPVITNAIDSIQLNGDVTKDMFENYCKASLLGMIPCHLLLDSLR